MHIPLVFKHLFYQYFFRRFVGQATKGKRASLFIDVVILVSVIKLIPFKVVKYRISQFRAKYI